VTSVFALYRNHIYITVITWTKLIFEHNRCWIKKSILSKLYTKNHLLRYFSVF